MTFRGAVRRTGMREMARLVVIEVAQGTAGGGMMIVETRVIETEVMTETEIGGATSIAMMIDMILALRGRAVIELAKGMDTTKMMKGGKKSDIELHECFKILLGSDHTQ
jgi:hypothetical protein